MIQLEIKKNVVCVYFVISVFLLYSLFLLGNSGFVLADNTSTTIIAAIWKKLHGNWETSMDSSCLVRMNAMWNDNSYLPILMPFICGMPGVMNYLEEIKSTNKRFILIRSSVKQYFAAKITANIVCSILIALFAVAFYYVTLFVFFDWIPLSDESFILVYFAITAKMVGNVKEISKFVLIIRMLKDVIYFCLYAVINGSFCYLVAVWCRDKYVTFGGTIFFCYLQHRICEELNRKYLQDNVTAAGRIADVLDPVFLHYAGYSGVYEKREVLAVAIALLMIAFNYFIVVKISNSKLDISER